MTIQAIETEYRGFKFRSRLEARWAVFFDALGVEWHYEHEGYETSTGRYLPDFWLPQVYLRNDKSQGVLFEVKPEGYEAKHDQLAEVCESLDCSGILACGFKCSDGISWEELTQIAQGWDNNMMIYKCPYCGSVKFDFSDSSYMDCPVCSKDGENGSCERVAAAYDKALRHRFW